MVLKRLMEGENPARVLIMAAILLIASLWYSYDNITAINQGKICGALYQFQQQCEKIGDNVACIDPSYTGNIQSYYALGRAPIIGGNHSNGT